MIEHRRPMIRRLTFTVALLCPLAAHAGIVDHLIRCDTEATCVADPVVGQYRVSASDDGPASWRGDVAIPDVKVYVVTGTTTDPATGQVTENRTYFPGWFLVIARPALDPALRDLPNGECRLIADRDAAEAGQSFILYTAPDIAPSDLANAFVTPTFAGSRYPFSGAQ